MEKKIEVKNISKTFKSNDLLKNVNMVFESHRIYGIIGPNGSGKSVLMKMICGLLAPDSGEVWFCGQRVYKDINVLPECGIIINKPAFFEDMNGFDNLMLFAKLTGKADKKRVEEVLELVELANDHKHVKNYSLGMLQRLGIAQAILENPDILILDEVTNALDESGIEMVYKLLKTERDLGKIIIITSHNKQDIDELCDGVFKINRGTIEYENKNN